MRILIDTNILITREEEDIVPSNLQDLLKILSQLNHQILVHPLSVMELAKDKNEKRRSIQLSKVNAYSQLEYPPNPDGDKEFLSLLGNIKLDDSHEVIDCNLLYCIHKNAAHFLITEDKDINKKSERLDISDRVFNIVEALEFFKRTSAVKKPVSPPSLIEVPMHSLDLKDPIFDSLKEEYTEFVKWWNEKAKEGRKVWAYHLNKTLGAILIYKIENEIIDSNPSMPKKNRLKISTLKVSYEGYKIGELLIKISINYAIKNNIDEIYLTHHTKPNDRLVNLIEQFGFFRTAKKISTGEDIFIKKLIQDEKCQTPLEVIKKFYPSFYDGPSVKKFIIPIRPEFHNRLFTDYYKRQPLLLEFYGKMLIEGNTIKKAYLCNSKLRGISIGDIIIFYRSGDEHALTSLGVVEKVFNNVRDPDKIEAEVGKRSVYTRKEMEKMAQKPTKIIMFTLNFHFSKPIKLDKLKKLKLLAGAPQSIMSITHNNYLRINEMCGIDKKFCIDKLGI